MLQRIIDETTPRRTMFVAGFVFIALGIAGLFAGWSEGDWIVMTTAKSVVFIVTGLFLEWVAEVWTTEWKRPVAAALAIVTAVVGVPSLVTDDLGFMPVGQPLEGVIYFAIAAAQGVALWWPRRFYDYEWGTGWSSGAKFASKPDNYMTSGLEKR